MWHSPPLVWSACCVRSGLGRMLPLPPPPVRCAGVSGVWLWVCGSWVGWLPILSGFFCVGLSLFRFACRSIMVVFSHGWFRALHNQASHLLSPIAMSCLTCRIFLTQVCLRLCCFLVAASSFHRGVGSGSSVCKTLRLLRSMAQSLSLVQYLRTGREEMQLVAWCHVRCVNMSIVSTMDPQSSACWATPSISQSSLVTKRVHSMHVVIIL